MISVDQAIEIVLRNTVTLGCEYVALNDAFGRVLREEVRADTDLPPFDRARMDGYAVRSADVQTAPVTLTVIGEVAAGHTFDDEVKRGQAVKIFTGAPMPAGADSVQQVELTKALDGQVVIQQTVTPGQFVTERASEVRAGDIAAGPGIKIGAAEMAVLASFGYSTVKVGARPHIAVLSTGSELVEVSAKPVGAQIRNSNTYTISSYARRDGAEVRTYGIVKDDPKATSDALLKATKLSDVVVTSGGVSMGDYDLVKAALVQLGAEVFFDKVSIRPGKPTVFARLDTKYFFCLPGNPVSTSVTYNVFVHPALRKMQGDSKPSLPVVRTVLKRAIKDSSDRSSYLPARTSIDEHGKAVAEPLKWSGSSDFVAFMRANSLIIVPEAAHQIAEGNCVDCVLLDQVE